jgi:hypothetical protein
VIATAAGRLLGALRAVDPKVLTAAIAAGLVAIAAVLTPNAASGLSDRWAQLAPPEAEPDDPGR